jgi:ankyrin repeat protein
VLSACSSLIVNVDDSPVVQFSHFSVKEFLMSSRLANVAEHLSFYHILPRSAHAVLARASLSVLLNLGDQVDKSIVLKRPFATYAARYWVNHGKFQGVSPSIQDLMERLFDPDRPYFATWVWIYDIDRPWKGSMATVHPTQPEAKPLYYAALCGFHSLMEQFAITHPTDVNARGGSRGTPLNAAGVKGEIDIALALLQNGANINALDCAGESSLHKAAKGSHNVIVNFLLEHQADVCEIRTDNNLTWTPLHVAALNVELKVCRLLLKHGADLASQMNDERTPLHVASQCGHLDIVRELLFHGADANAQDEDLCTPLHTASQCGHLDIVQELLFHGADANAQDEDLCTPLHVASGEGYLEIVQSQVQHGATINKKNMTRDTPLHNASYFGNLETARFLVEQGTNMTAKDNGGWTPVQYAVHNGHVDLVEMFLGCGVDINVKNTDGETLLDFASQNGKLEVARFLIDHGADVDCCDQRGWTPLHTAARFSHLDVVRLLVEHSTNVHARNGIHNPPLLASPSRVSRFPSGHRVDVNSADYGGWTPLHLASRHGHTDVVQLLLDNGADVNLQTKDLLTPLHHASVNGHLKVAELLIERGAEVDEDQETQSNLASGNGKLEVARLCGSNLNSQRNEGSTPLHLGARHRYLSLVDILISCLVGLLVESWANSRVPTTMTLTASESGSQNSLPEIVEPPLYDGGSSNDEEGTSLHSALKSGRLALVQELLDRGADVNDRDELLCTPLGVASKHGELEVARTLIEVNATEMEDSTALHTASMFGHFEVVRLLLERGANVQTRCVYGRTPSQYASMYGHQKIAQLLTEYGMGGVLGPSERCQWFVQRARD